MTESRHSIDLGGDDRLVIEIKGEREKLAQILQDVKGLTGAYRVPRIQPIPVSANIPAPCTACGE